MNYNYKFHVQWKYPSEMKGYKDILRQRKTKRMFCYQTPDLYLEIDKRNFFKQKGNDFFKKEVESWSIRKEERTMERTEMLVHIKDYPIPHI